MTAVLRVCDHVYFVVSTHTGKILHQGLQVLIIQFLPGKVISPQHTQHPTPNAQTASQPDRPAPGQTGQGSTHDRMILGLLSPTVSGHRRVFRICGEAHNQPRLEQPRNQTLAGPRHRSPASHGPRRDHGGCDPPCFAALRTNHISAASSDSRRARLRARTARLRARTARVVVRRRICAAHRSPRTHRWSGPRVQSDGVDAAPAGAGAGPEGPKRRAALHHAL
jgi:hypothetical protein